MKFCTRCGNKLKEDAKYCQKCGNPTKMELERIERERRNKKEEKNENILLYLGSALIIISSIIFAFSNWQEMSHVFRILFLVVEMIIFLSLSIFSKGFKNHLPYKTLWFVGLLFLPVIIILIAKYGVFGKYLSYAGAGIFVYLSISWLLSAILNVFSYKLLNAKIFIYMSYIYFYAFIVNVLNIFSLNNIGKMNLIFPILCALNLIIIIIYNLFKEKLFRITLNKFMAILSFVFAFILFLVLGDEKISSYILGVSSNTVVSKILVSICSVTNVISLLMLMKEKNRCPVSYTYPFFILFNIIDLVYILLSNNYNIYIFISVLASILIYFVINLFNNKGYRIFSFLLMLYVIYAIIAFENLSFKIILIITSLGLIAKMFSSKLHSKEVEKTISALLYPLDIVLIVTSVLGILEKANNMTSYITIYIISSLICFTLHVIIDTKNKDKLNNILFEIFSYIFLVISSFMILGGNGNITLFILNELSFVYYFIYRTIKKKDKSINTLLYIVLLINFLTCSVRFDVSLYYIILFISFINIVMYLIRLKIEKKKITAYFYTSFILSIIASLCNLSNYNLMGVCANILLYVLIYFVSIKNIKINYILRYIYTVIGFILIYKLLDYFIDESLIVNAIALPVFIVVIISMFLLEVDDDRQVLAYTPVILVPYFELVELVDIFRKISVELHTFIIVVLIFIFVEKVLKISRENDKILVELILLGFVSFITIGNMLIFNFILAVFYIFYGLYKKRDSFVVFGIVLILISVFTKLIEIADNLLSTYILLLLGATLVIYVFCKESKRNKRNK